MATLDQWAYNIRNLARAGFGNSDDERLGIRQIKFWIQAYRASAVEQMTDFGKDIDPQLLSDFGILTLQEIDRSDTIACQGIEWGCPIMKVTIPKLVSLPKNRGLVFIGKIDKQSNFERDSGNVTEFRQETRFGKLITRYFIVGQTVYIMLSKKDEGIMWINGRGIVEDPTSLKTWVLNDQNECEEVCFNDATDEYPMPLKMYEYITRQILVTELGFTIQTVEDLLNNAQNEVQGS